MSDGWVIPDNRACNAANDNSESFHEVPTQLSPFSSQQFNAFANADEPDAPDRAGAGAGAGAGAAAAAGAAQLQTLH